MKKGLLFVLTMCMAAGMLSGCGHSSENAENASGESGNLLVVGVRTNLANFSSYNEEADTYYGFEDDLARSLAKMLGYDGVEFVGLLPEEREDALESGEVQCLIAAYSETEERTEKFDLSDPYYYDQGRVMVERSTLFEDYADLQGATVAVRTGTTAQENLEQKLAGLGLISQATDESLSGFLKIETMDTYEEMNSALDYGTVDALCADGCITLPWLDEERRYFEDAYSDEDYVVATAKGSDLSAEVNEALQTLMNDGTVDELLLKWGV